MSALSAAAGSPSLATAALPPIAQASEPASVRNGDQAAKNAYQTGLAFENVLVNELAQQLSATVPGLDGSDDGLGGTSDDSSDSGSTGGVGGAGGLGAYSSLLPQTLTSSIMAGGGVDAVGRIVAERDRESFRTLADLDARVRGIGPVTAAVAMAAWSHEGRLRDEAEFASLRPLSASQVR